MNIGDSISLEGIVPVVVVGLNPLRVNPTGDDAALLKLGWEKEANWYRKIPDSMTQPVSPEEMLNLPPEKQQELHNECTNSINQEIQRYKAAGAMKNAKGVSDGYHTFEELYEFRAVLNIALFKTKRAEELAKIQYHGQGFYNPTWRSKLHSDGTMFEGMFILGLGTEPGKQITFHYHLDKWEACDFAETLEKAPEWDGHTPADVLERLKAL